jgi:hypothetical protein
MAKITNESQFKSVLGDQSLQRQRQLAAIFIEQVLDLVDDPRITEAVALVKAGEADAEQLHRAHQAVHACYVETHPRSDLMELDFKRQAAHFVTEACLVCLSPVFHCEQKVALAHKAAMYCRMARTCAGMKHDQEQPDLSGLGDTLGTHIQQQFEAAENFLNS